MGWDDDIGEWLNDKLKAMAMEFAKKELTKMEASGDVPDAVHIKIKDDRFNGLCLFRGNIREARVGVLVFAGMRESCHQINECANSTSSSVISTSSAMNADS